MSIRPPVVYGPHDYTSRFEYWIDRVREYDRLLVPYTALRHLAVDDVASGLRAIAEHGDAGEAYNIGTHTLPVLSEWIERLAGAVGTSVELTEVGERELAVSNLDPSDFPLYRAHPHVLDTHKLESIGWDATPLHETILETVEYIENNTTTSGPDREAEIAARIDTVEDRERQLVRMALY